MTLVIRSWGKWQSGILTTMGKSRIKNKVDPSKSYAMPEVLISAGWDADFMAFQRELKDDFADALWRRTLMYCAHHAPLTGALEVQRGRFGAAVLSTPWQSISASKGRNVYDALVVSGLAAETCDRPRPIICASHKRYLCQKKDGTCSEYVPNENRTSSDSPSPGSGPSPSYPKPQGASGSTSSLNGSSPSDPSAKALALDMAGRIVKLPEHVLKVTACAIQVAAAEKKLTDHRVQNFVDRVSELDPHVAGLSRRAVKRLTR